MQDTRSVGHGTTELDSEHPREQVKGSASAAADITASQREYIGIGEHFEVCRRSETAYAA